MSSTLVTDTPFLYEDHPDHPGWKRWAFRDETRFNAFLGDLIVRVEDGTGDRVARVRMLPERRHSNLIDRVHGGALLGFIDVSLFAASRSFGLLSASGALTLDLSTQFIATGTLDEPLEARVEMLRETGRLLFLRGLVVQEAGTIASFAATVRKPSAR